MFLNQILSGAYLPTLTTFHLLSSNREEIVSSAAMNVMVCDNVDTY